MSPLTVKSYCNPKTIQFQALRSKLQRQDRSAHRGEVFVFQSFIATAELDERDAEYERDEE